MESYTNFYPTPEALGRKMLENFDFKKAKSILEPSAGKGDLLEVFKCLLKKKTYRDECDMDCIELNADLRDTLKGKGYRVVHDDWLTYQSFKHYDLILMNPPFDNGVQHLLKAIRYQQQSGGSIICLLNAETIKNPYSNDRQQLIKLIDKYAGDVEYMTKAFSSAERITDVEIALVIMDIPQPQTASIFYEEMKKAKAYKEMASKECAELVEGDFIKSIVQFYEVEVAAGVKFLEEYRALAPRIKNVIGEDKYSSPLISVKVGGHEFSDSSINAYVRSVRLKYWEALFSNKTFTGNMPSDMANSYRAKVMDLAEYEFSVFNILELKAEICKELLRGIEGSIIKLFEEMTYMHAWTRTNEFSGNIHYYNGWATNKAYYVSNKVILPCHSAFGYFRSDSFDPTWELMEKLTDLEKALDYLNGTPGRPSNLIRTLDYQKRIGNNRNIETEYFTVSFYKKGTMHITYKNEDLIKKLNIFAGKKFNMLPPSYGYKPFSEMTEDEKAVVLSFDGTEEAYASVYAEYEDKYKVTTESMAIPLLEA